MSEESYCKKNTDPHRYFWVRCRSGPFPTCSVNTFCENQWSISTLVSENCSKIVQNAWWSKGAKMESENLCIIKKLLQFACTFFVVIPLFPCFFLRKEHENIADFGFFVNVLSSRSPIFRHVCLHAT